MNPDLSPSTQWREQITAQGTARLSNGGLDRAPGRTPDVRGFAIQVNVVPHDAPHDALCWCPQHAHNL